MPVSAEELQDKIQQKLRQVQAAQAEAETQVEETDQAFNEADAKGRQCVAVIFVSLFALVILTSVVYSLFKSTTTKDDIAAVLDDFVYPTVLLVLGYYFGKSDSEDA